MAPSKDDQATIWRGEINSSLKDQSRIMQELLIEIKQRPTRPEIETMLLQKVDVGIYNAELKSIRDDIAELRARPESLKSWIGAGVGLVGLGSTLILLFAQHWK